MVRPVEGPHHLVVARRIKRHRRPSRRERTEDRDLLVPLRDPEFIFLLVLKVRTYRDRNPNESHVHAVGDANTPGAAQPKQTDCHSQHGGADFPSHSGSSLKSSMVARPIYRDKLGRTFGIFRLCRENVRPWRAAGPRSLAAGPVFRKSGQDNGPRWLPLRSSMA